MTGGVEQDDVKREPQSLNPQPYFRLLARVSHGSEGP